jgi:glycosyltransferase involved in cell wall biosynthesis
VRILHTLASPAWSGPAEGVALLADAQCKLGHEVKVAIDRKRHQVSSEEIALPYLETMGLLDERNLELSVKSSPTQVWRDVRALKHFEVDIIHCHFTHDHTVTFFGRPAMATVIRSIHAPRSLRWSTPRASGWTVPTQALADQLAPAKCLVMPALVAPEFKPPSDRAALRRELGVEGSPLIGMVSTFQNSRHHDVGIDAFALVKRERPDARLVLIGDGQLEAVLRARVLSHGIADAVTFPGYQPGADFVRWTQAFDEVWVLGLGNDFSGRAAAQARACGSRVIAVDEGALSTLADELVPLDSEAIANASSSGTRKAIEVLRPEQIAAQVIGLYERARAK